MTSLLQAFADAWNRHDIDALMSMMTPDCVFEASGGNAVDGERHEGQPAVRAAYARVFEEYPDAHWGNARHFIAGERGVSEWTFTGTRKDDKRVEVTGCDVFTFRDGKIAVKNSFRKNRPPAGRPGTMAGPAELKQAGWYTRPVLYVADVNRAIRFYVDMLGFVKHWHEADGAGTVCQVNRGDCEIILCQHATRRDKARLFIELTTSQLAQLRAELLERGVPTTTTWWGYDSIQIDDPDGHELLFPIEGNTPA